MRLTVMLATLALALTLALPALAESPPADNATSAPPAKGTRLSEVLVTATRHEARVDTVPNAVTVITREQIDKMVAPTTIDILKDAAGVEVYNARGFIGSSTYNRVIMRGMGATPARILVLLNGIPQTDAQQQTFEWSFINPRDIERIEVVRGPGSALYGAQAMGGVINIITRTPKEEKAETTLGASYGTFNTVRTDASHLRKDGKWGLYVSGSVGGTEGYSPTPKDAVRHSNGQPTNNLPIRQRNEWGRTQVSYDIDPSQTLTMGAMYGHFANHGGLNYMPEFLLFEMYRETGNIKYAKRFAGGELNAYLSAGYQSSGYDYQSTAGATYNKVKNYDSGAIMRDYLAGVNLSYDLGLGNTGTLGMDLQNLDYSRRNEYVTGDLNKSMGGKTNSLGLFAQDELKLFDGRVIIVPGIRWNYWESHDGYTQDRAIAAPGNGVTYYDHNIKQAFTSRIAVRYNATGWLSVRGAYGEAFRTPTLGEMYNVSSLASTTQGDPSLMPEYLKSKEIGVDLNPLDNLRLAATFYQSHVSNYIERTFVSAGPPTVYKYKNVSVVDVAGIETEAEYTFYEHWKALANYQHTDPKIMVGAYKGQRIAGTPLSVTTLGLEFNDPELFNARVVNRRVGKIFYGTDTTGNNNGPNATFGKYDVVDAKIAKAFLLSESRLGVSLECQNLFDVKTAETNSAWGPGRMIFLRTDWTF
ncbi:MAG: TonB-dependent receptor [Proteobacteria bacterium]|nr:TonB-dependent receptor [Pseudomonadota bacterium]MBU1596088.1 TonB-dependent receptor [Pseudomonadota bacterium]